MKDEGPLFSTRTGLNATTEEEVKDYFGTCWWPKATEAQLNRLMDLYHQDSTRGSPYDTGLRTSEVGPQYTRFAASVAGYTYEAQRRKSFTEYPGKIYTYQAQVTVPLSVLRGSPLDGLLNGTGATDIPVLASFHAFDGLFYLFETTPAALSNNVVNIMSTWISFMYNQEPNQHGFDLPNWPQ